MKNKSYSNRPRKIFFTLFFLFILAAFEVTDSLSVCEASSSVEIGAGRAISARVGATRMLANREKEAANTFIETEETELIEEEHSELESPKTRESESKSEPEQRESCEYAAGPSVANESAEDPNRYDKYEDDLKASDEYEDALKASDVHANASDVYAKASDEYAKASEESSKASEYYSDTYVPAEAVSENGESANYYEVSEWDIYTPVPSKDGRLYAAALPSLYPSDISVLNTDYPVVRNQNPYGVCWAFSTISLAEMSMIKQGFENIHVDYSELALVYGVRYGSKDPLGNLDGIAIVNPADGASTYLHGANAELAANVLFNWNGVVEEAKVPYSWALFLPGRGLSVKEATACEAHIRNLRIISTSGSRSQIKSEVISNGGVSTSYYDSKASEYFNAESAAYYCDKEMAPNHAVTIVGWDDSFSKNNFNIAPKADGAWLVRNSWGGSGISKQGYFWLSYYDKSLSDAGYAMDFDPVDKYERNYQYDDSPYTSYLLNYSGDSSSMANVFSCAKSYPGYEQLKAVSFMSPMADTSYSVSIYLDPADGDPQSGRIVNDAGVSGKFSYPGVYTVDLAKAVKLKAGQKFAVVVTLKSTITKLSFERTQTSGNFTHEAKVKAGQSYYLIGSNAYSKWKDIAASDYSSMGSARIKAYTTSGKDFVPASSINAASSMKLEKGQSADIAASILPLNATFRTAADISYESSNTKVASVDKNGKVKALAKGECNIKISATDGSGICKICKLSVSETVKVSSVKLDRSKATVAPSKSLKLNVTVEPSNAANRKVSFTSSDSSVAKVDDMGNVKAGNKPGSAVITVTSVDGKKTAKCNITVGFTDVSDVGKYYYKPVYWAAERGITNGYDDGSFGPGKACTRAHVVTFLWRLAGEPEPKSLKNPFNDVKKSDYYYKAVLWAAQNGISNGYSSGAHKGGFGPNLTCLREHVVTFLWRYAGKPGARNVKNTFKDLKSTDYFYNAALWAKSKGIANGYSSGKLKGCFGPKEKCLREHVVTFLYRYAK